MLNTFKKYYEFSNILIVESNKDEIYQKYYKDVIEREVFDKITSMFQNNNEVRWIVQAFRRLNSDQEKIRFLNEDMPHLRELFDQLNTLKRKNVAEAKSLNLFSIKSIPQLSKTIDEILSSTANDDVNNVENNDGNIIKKGNDWKLQFVGKDGKVLNMEKLFENNEYIVVLPKDEHALGESTRGYQWCTSYDRDDCHASSYTKEKNHRGNGLRVYLIKNKKDKKKSYLFHFLSNQMHDRHNDAMSIDDIQNASPALKEAMMSLIQNDEIKEEILNSSDASLNYLMLIDSMEENENNV